MGLHATLGTALRNAMKRPPDDEVSDMMYRYRSPLEPDPGGFASDVLTLERSTPTDPPAVDLEALPSTVGRAPAPPIDRSIKEAALPPAPATRPLSRRPRTMPMDPAIKPAAGGSPRFMPPSAPDVDLSSAVENMPRPMLSTRSENLTTGAESMRPPSDPTNLRDPLRLEMERRSPSYSDYQAERDRLPSEQEYIDQNRPKGFGRRLLSAAKLGGKFLVASGLNPIVALEGLAIGAADKNANARFTYRTDVEPRSVDRQRRQLSFAGNELGMANTIEDNRRADEQMRQTSEFQRATLTNRDQDAALRRDQYNLAVRRHLDDIQLKIHNARTQQEKDHWEREFKLAQEAGQRGVLTPPEQAEALGAPYLANTTRPQTDKLPEWAADPNPPDFDAEIKKRMDVWRQGHYGTLGLTPEVAELYPERKQQAEASLYQRAKDSIEAEANKRKASNRRLAPRPQGGTASGIKHKEGDMVTVGGKQVRIKKIYPDGTFDPE